jgi:hypothetical protein
VWDPDLFQGRTVVYVGAVSDAIRDAFEEVEPTQQIVHQVSGLPVAHWQVTVCRGFHGFGELQTRGY